MHSNVKRTGCSDPMILISDQPPKILILRKAQSVWLYFVMSSGCLIFKISCCYCVLFTRQKQCI